MFAALIILTLLVAFVDWWAVIKKRQDVRFIFKPATLAVLIVAALFLPDSVDTTVKVWMIAGLVFSLLGDIFLMLDEKYFVAGLASFLVGHIAYVVGLAQVDFRWQFALIGVVIIAAAGSRLALPIVRGGGRIDGRLRGPVTAYMAVISAMVIAAAGTGDPILFLGALLFYASDAVLGWNRFVEELTYGPILVMTMYHLGQIGLVVGLAAEISL